MTRLNDPCYIEFTLILQDKGVPVLTPYVASENGWRLDTAALRNNVTAKTKALFIMNPSMPSGALLNRSEWEEIIEICTSKDLLFIYNAAMERILYDDNEYIHPLSFKGMKERTIVIGSVSKEFRMIGWRIGWVAGPKDIMNNIALVGIYNVVTPTGISQSGAYHALKDASDITDAVEIWRLRRDTIMSELSDFPIVPAAGGWSFLMDVGKMGYDSSTASKLLLEKGKIAATPMKNWGDVNSDQYVRFVFVNETVERLKGIREKVINALGVYNCDGK